MEAPNRKKRSPMVCPIKSTESKVIFHEYTVSFHGKDEIPTIDLYTSEFNEVEVLGSGVQGLVVRSTSIFDLKDYAVKKVVLFDYNRSTTIDEYEKKLREPRIWAEMDHGNVVRCHHCWLENRLSGAHKDPDPKLPAFSSFFSKDDGCLYMKLELCHGKLDLEKLKGNRQQIADRFLEVLAGVQHIHEKGYFHNDLKVGNILIGLNGEAKITDFGMADESGEDGKRGDLRNLGNLIVEMLGGNPEEIRNLKIFPHTWNEELVGYIKQMLYPEEDTPVSAILSSVKQQIKAAILK